MCVIAYLSFVGISSWCFLFCLVFLCVSSADLCLAFQKKYVYVIVSA